MTNLAHDFEKAISPLDSFVMSMQDAGSRCAELASATFNPSMDNKLAAFQAFEHN